MKQAIAIRGDGLRPVVTGLLRFELHDDPSAISMIIEGPMAPIGYLMRWAGKLPRVAMLDVMIQEEDGWPLTGMRIRGCFHFFWRSRKGPSAQISVDSGGPFTALPVLWVDANGAPVRAMGIDAN